MKTLLSIAFILFIGTSMAQEPKAKTIKFKTSAICGECKERIEDKLNYTKGVVYAELDLDTKIIEVKYKTKYLTEKAVKKLVASVGYDAGKTPRDTEAFKKLPKCCKSAGHCERKK